MKLYRILGSQVCNVEVVRAIPCVLWGDHDRVAEGAMRLDASNGPIGKVTVRTSHVVSRSQASCVTSTGSSLAFLMKRWTLTCSTLSEASGDRRSYSVVPQAPTRSTCARSALLRSRQKIRKASNSEPAPSHAGTLPQSRARRLRGAWWVIVARHCAKAGNPSGNPVVVTAPAGMRPGGRRTGLDLRRRARASPGGRPLAYF
jgi:hypothetical protein